MTSALIVSIMFGAVSVSRPGSQPEARLVGGELGRQLRRGGRRRVLGVVGARVEHGEQPLVQHVGVAEVRDRAVGVDREHVVAQRAAPVRVDAGRTGLREVGQVLGAVAGGAQDRAQRAAAARPVDDDPLGAAGHRRVIETQVADGRLGVHGRGGGLAGERAVRTDQPAAPGGDVGEDVARLQRRAHVARRAVVGRTGGDAAADVAGHPARVVDGEVDRRALVGDRALGHEHVHALIAAARVGDARARRHGRRVGDVTDLGVLAHGHRLAVDGHGQGRERGSVEGERRVLRVGGERRGRRQHRRHGERADRAPAQP